MRTSIVQKRGAVTFPRNTGERHYMIGFYQGLGLPSELSRWQPTVDAMLEGIQTDHPIYLMVDQGFVKAGTPQRRPGMHIDGYWNPAVYAHRSEPTHVPTPPQHHSPTPGHCPIPRHGSKASSWDSADYSAPEAIILASDIAASRALQGKYYGTIANMGDCSDVVPVGELVHLQANTAYAGNVCMLHESLPVEVDCWRTLVRLNVPGWTPK